MSVPLVCVTQHINHTANLHPSPQHRPHITWGTLRGTLRGPLRGSAHLPKPASRVSRFSYVHVSINSPMNSSVALTATPKLQELISFHPLAGLRAYIAAFFHAAPE